MKNFALTVVLTVFAACGPLPEGEDDAGEVELVAPDDGTGDAVVLEEEAPDAGDCLEGCDADAGDEAPFDGVPDLDDAGVEDAGVTPRDGGAPTPWVVGAKFVTRSYVSFRVSPADSSALITAVQPGAGVDDATHVGQPRGVLPPGQVVVLTKAAATGAYRQVRFDGKVGWVGPSALHALKAGQHPVDLALEPHARNAFYKNQLRRSRWNKDGPLSSGTCAPTSLAMAARIFGHEPAGLSVEESIHRARRSYGATSDSTGTMRSQIRTGALALGLSVATLDTRLSLSAMLTRLDGQLAKKRVVVLEGQPGDATTTTPTAYQAAFNRAYAAADVSRRYTFDGRHSVLLVGKQSDGKYVVSDPISEVGPLALTAGELKDLFARWGGTGNAVW